MAATGIAKYTLNQVNEHNKGEDLWVIIRDKVYDLTRFLNEHPGGPEVLEEVAGKDATKDFDDVGHSTDAVEQMKQYHIGDIVKDENKSKESVNSGSNQDKKKKICISVCSVLAIGVGVFLIYQSYKYIKSS